MGRFVIIFGLQAVSFLKRLRQERSHDKSKDLYLKYIFLYLITFKTTLKYVYVSASDQKHVLPLGWHNKVSFSGKNFIHL